MSLDVTIHLKEPKVLKYWDTQGVCGSTVAVVPEGYEEVVDHIHLNITHNMGEMADHVPVTYHDTDSDDWYEATLYQMVWRPDTTLSCRGWSSTSATATRTPTARFRSGDEPKTQSI